jgi:hypothetical protein
VRSCSSLLRFFAVMVVVCALLFRSSELYHVGQFGAGFVLADINIFSSPPSLTAISIEHIEAQKRKRASRIAGTSCNRFLPRSTPRMDSAFSHQKGTDQTIKSTERWVTTLRHLARNYLRRRILRRRGTGESGKDGNLDR